MRTQVLLILLVLAMFGFTLEGCNDSSSSNSPPTGGGGEEPPDPPPGEGPANIVLEEDDLVLEDPASDNDGIAAPGETITYALKIQNTGENLGRIDIQDLNVQPSSSLAILSKLVDGVPVSDFTQVEVPAEGQVMVTGTARVDPLITPPVVIVMGPPKIIPSSPPSDPETLVDEANIKGSDTMAVEEEGEPPPQPPAEGRYHVRRPGSLLIYPFYRVQGQPTGGTIKDTLITVTNINSDTKLTEHGLPAGTIDILFSYQDSEDCWPLQIWERLTPNDTLSLMVGDHIPYFNLSQGWLYVVAQDPITGELVDFDHLIGHATYFDADDTVWFQYNPVVVRAVPGDGLPTDLDFDGNIDLNGEEYEKVGDNQMFPRFIGGLPAGPGVQPYHASILFLNLSGGAAFDSQVNLLVYNDNEQAWSTMFPYHCWHLVPLEDIEVLFTNSWLLGSNHDPDEELEILGHENVETGWFEVDGNSAWSPVKVIDDPAFMCFMLEYYNNRVQLSSPFDNGVKQDNATLWPLSALGDNED